MGIHGSGPWQELARLNIVTLAVFEGGLTWKIAFTFHLVDNGLAWMYIFFFDVIESRL